MNRSFSVSPAAGRLLALFLMLLLAAAPAAVAQSPGDIGVGGQLGDPSGVSIVFERANSSIFDAYDFLAAWDFSEDELDRFFINAHGLITRRVGNSARLFYGPGLFVGFIDYDESDEEDDVEAGASMTFGLGVFLDRIELYARLTPRLAVIPETDGEFGGGLGIRFHF